MRTASMVLGIVGGCLALLIGALAILGGVAFNTMPPIDHSEFYAEHNLEYDQAEVDQSQKTAISMFFVLGGIICLFGLLGIAGGILAKKKNILAGIFMLFSGGLCFSVIWAILAAIPLILGGIFALVKEKPHEKAVKSQAI